jgi:hypothetical protein
VPTSTSSARIWRKPRKARSGFLRAGLTVFCDDAALPVICWPHEPQAKTAEAVLAPPANADQFPVE